MGERKRERERARERERERKGERERGEREREGGKNRIIISKTAALIFIKFLPVPK